MNTSLVFYYFQETAIKTKYRTLNRHR